MIEVLDQVLRHQSASLVVRGVQAGIQKGDIQATLTVAIAGEVREIVAVRADLETTLAAVTGLLLRESWA